jgi:hypothetical protein
MEIEDRNGGMRIHNDRLIVSDVLRNELVATGVSR